METKKKTRGGENIMSQEENKPAMMEVQVYSRNEETKENNMKSDGKKKHDHKNEYNNLARS